MGDEERVVARFGATPVRTIRSTDALVARVVDLAGAGRAHLLIDEHVELLHADELLQALERQGVLASVHSIESGEASKSVARLAESWSFLARAGVQRADLIVAVGGGVTTDLGGFVAATMLRGVRWVAVATTVLAMADAAVGGKTGIDLPEGKNLVGAFAPPLEVLLWTSVLVTLPQREVRAGIAEVVKCAWLEGEDAVAEVERAGEDVEQGDVDALQRLIARAVAFKCRIVDEDPLEQGVRRVLNFGHTFGHAVESGLGPDAIVHGEAVAIGMVMALEFSAWLGCAPASAPKRMRALLMSLRLPVDPPRLPVETWSAYMGRDKKREGDSVRFVVAGAPGTWSIDPIAVEKFAIWLRFAKHAA